MPDKKINEDRARERDEILARISDVPFIAEELSTRWDEGEGTWMFTFNTLHVPKEGSIHTRTWNLTAAQAELYFMGFIDGANYTMQLFRMAAEREADDA